MASADAIPMETTSRCTADHSRQQSTAQLLNDRQSWEGSYSLPPDQHSPNSPLHHGERTGESAGASSSFINTAQRPRQGFGFTWDLLSLLLATASLSSLFVLLHSYNGQPNPDWSVGKIGVTLNAIVSILGTVFRASLLLPVADSLGQFGWLWYRRLRPLQDICDYDSASRGPFGSLIFLSRLRLKKFADLAALVTLLAVALDPFFQQTVRYTNHAVKDSTQKAQLATSYSWGDDLYVEGEIGNAYYGLPHDIKSAILSGLLASDDATPPTPPFICPTGNCTWDPFSTLAFSAKCVNLTSEVKIACTPKYGDISCQYTAPNDTNLQAALTNAGQWSAMRVNTTPTYYVAGGSLGLDPTVLIPYKNVTGTIGMVQWVKSTKHSLKTSDPIQKDTPYDAGRCFLYFSVKRISASVTTGVYTETVLQEYTYAQRNGATVEPYVYNNISYYIADPLSNDPIVFHPPFAAASPNSSNTYTVPAFALYMLTSLFGASDFLNGEVNTASLNGMQGPDIPLLLFQAPNVLKAVENLSQYVTNSMRRSGPLVTQKSPNTDSFINSSQAISGVTWTQQQYVVVRWPWLALPATLLVLAALVLLAVFWETRRQAIGAWKSSPLTLLLHTSWTTEASELVGRKAETGALFTSKAMEKVAESLRAKIMPGPQPRITLYAANDGSGDFQE